MSDKENVTIDTGNEAQAIIDSLNFNTRDKGQIRENFAKLDFEINNLEWEIAFLRLGAKAKDLDKLIKSNINIDKI